MTRPPRALLLAFAVLAAACASTSPDEAFSNTAALVLARTGRRIAWNRGSAEDQAVAAKVRDLLARELPVDAAVQIALLQNRDLQATYEDLSIAQADLVQAGLLENPVFGGGVVFPVAGTAETGGSVSVSEDFLGVFLLAARKRIARARLRATELRVGDAVLRLANDVEVAFYGLASAEQLLALKRTILETGELAVELAAGQHAAGSLSDLDLASQEALYEQVRADVLRTEADVVTARERLTRLLGLWGQDTAYRVAAKLPELPEAEPPLERLESLAVGRRMDLLAAREDARAASHALALVKSTRWIGGASVGAGYERSPEGFSVAGPSGAVALPVFDQKQATVARLEAELRAVLDREGALAIQIRSEVRAARSRMQTARAIASRYASVIVPLRQRVVALTEEHYAAMLVGTFQLLSAKQSEIVAYRELIEAVRDYWIARADLERTTGGAIVLGAPSRDVPIAGDAP